MTTTRLLQLFTKSVFAFLAVFALSASMVVAQDTWYVNSTEGDDLTNDGSQLNNSGGNVGPFATLNRAITAASDGDTIVVLAGTYGEDFDNGGKDVTIQAINSGGTLAAVFTGNLVVTDGDADNNAFSVGSLGGKFRVTGATGSLTDGVLTLNNAGVNDASPVLNIGTGMSVTVVDASVAGAAVNYEGLVNVDYAPTNAPLSPANRTTGLEFPSDFGGGNLSTNAAFDNGSLQVAQTVVGANNVTLDGDVDVTFNQAVTYGGTLNVNTANSVAFNSTLTGGDVEQAGDASVTVASAANLGYIDLDDGLLTFNSTLVLTANEGGQAIDVAVGAELDLNGAANVVGGNIINAGEATTVDVDIDANNFINSGTFVMASTLTVGDNGVAGAFGAGGAARVTNNGGAMTIDNVVLERDDDVNADDVDDYWVEFANLGGTFTVDGSVTEYDAADAGGVFGTLTAVLEVNNADNADFVFNSTNTLSGDVLNAATGAPGAPDEGINVATGQTLTLTAAGLTDLGIFYGGTLVLEGAGEDATGLEAVGNLIMAAGTGALAQNVVATGSVTLNANVTHTVNFDVDGVLTVNAGADINDVPGLGAETHTVGGLVVGATGSVFGLAGDQDSFTVSGNVALLDATVHGNVNGSGTFSADGATVNGNVTSGGMMTLDTVTINFVDGTFSGNVNSGGSIDIIGSTVDGTFNAAGDVTQSGTTALGDGVNGVGASLSDIDGTLFVNGTLNLTNDGGDTFDLTVGGVDIAIPGGTLNLDNVDLLVNGDFVGGTMNDADFVHFILPNNGSASFTPGPNTVVTSFALTGSNATLTVNEGFSIDGIDSGVDPLGYGLSVNNDAILALTDNTITFTASADGVDVELNDEAQITTSAPTGALVFSTGAAGSTIDVTGAPTNPPVLSNFRVNSPGTVVTIIDELFVSGDITINAGTLVIGDDAGDVVTMTGAGAIISRNPFTGMLTEGPGDLDGAWDVKYFGQGGTATAEISNDGTGTTNNVTLGMDGIGQVVTFDGVANGDSNAMNFTVNTGTAYFSDAYSIGQHLTNNGGFHADDDIAVAGNATFNTSADFDSELTVSGDLTVAAGAAVTDTAVDGSGVGGVAGTMVLDGTDATHSVEGRVMIGTTATAAATMTGSTSQLANRGEFDGAPFALNAPGATFTATNMQKMGAVTVVDGTLDLTMFDDGDNNTVVGGDASSEDSDIEGAITVWGTMILGGNALVADVDGVTVRESGSLTLGTNVDVDGGMVDLGTLGGADTTAPVLDLGGNTLTVSGNFPFDAEAESDISNGTIEIAGGHDIGTNGATVDNLTFTNVNAVVSQVEVLGLLVVNEDVELDADLVLAGTGTFGAGDDILETDGGVNPPEFRMTGASLTLVGDIAITNFDVASAATTQLLDGDPNNNDAETITTSMFTHTSGTYDLGQQHQTVTGSYTYVAGDYAATSGIFTFSGATYATGGADVVIPNVAIEGGGIDMADNTGLTATAQLWLLNGVSEQNDNDADADVATITVGDGATMVVDDANLEFTPSYGMNIDVRVVDWDLGGTVDANLVEELPNTFNSLTIDSPATLNGGKDITVNTLDLNAAFNNEPANALDESVTITDGGNVFVAITNALTESVNTLGEWSLTYDGGAVTTSNITLPNDPNGPTTVNFNGAVTALHANRTVQNVTVGAGAELELGLDGATDGFGNDGGETLSSLTILGDLTVAPTGSVTAGGALILMGVDGTQQITASGGMTLPNVTLDNPDGANLTGGNLTITNLLTLTDGVLATNDNVVILPHTNTAAQGYAQTDGVIFGNVQKTIAPVAPPAPPNRVAFPLGSSDGFDREYAITFNDPGNDLGIPVTLTVSLKESDPMGTNGLPIATQDDLGNDFMVGRYPREFHWEIESAPTISPSVSYDIEYRAEAFTGFEGEDIERTRAMRRQAGDPSNFWILTSPVPTDNDNFDANSNPANPPEPVVVARNAVGAINSDGALFTFGLEANMMATDPAPVVVNAGSAAMLDLLTVFSGGDEMYTYQVIGGDAAVATTAVNGDNLVVTGVDAGATSFTVEGMDGFGDTATATVIVNVNPAFEAAEDIADYSVNVGDADRMIDATTAVTGGTTPYTYAVSSSDSTVAVASVDGSGQVTVTHAAAGLATITLTITDATGDTVVDTFNVAVNEALVAAGGLADVSVTEDETVSVDVSGEFSGGTPGTEGYSYTATSDNPDVATAAAGTGDTIDVTGEQPYVIVDGSVDSDAAPATITVTAEDSLGATGVSTFMADVNPVPGNVDGFGPNPASAGLTLDFFLNLATGTPKQQLAANFNGDASITPFDAALIFSAFLNSKDEIEPYVAAGVGFGQISHENGMIEVPVLITGELDGVVSANLAARIDKAFATVKSVESQLGDGWLFGHNLSEEGDLKLAIAGMGDVPSDGVIATITLELAQNSQSFDLSGEGAVNNNPLASIDAVEVAELPEKFALDGNYPNPFNPTTTVQFDLPETADVEIQVFDMLGRQVMTLPAQTIQAGAKRSVQVNASQLASGQYFYRVIAKMESKTLVESGRMTLVK